MVKVFPLLSDNIQLFPKEKGPDYGVFVPEMMSVPDFDTSPVNHFYYTGPDVAGFHKGYFYDKVEISPAVTDVESYTIPKNGPYIDILADINGTKAGRYYLISNYKYLAEMREKYSPYQMFFHIGISEESTDGRRYKTPGLDVLEIGDYVLCLDDNKYYQIQSLSAGYPQYPRYVFLDNGVRIKPGPTGGSTFTLDAYVNESGDMLFYSVSMGLYVANKLLEVPEDWKEGVAITPGLYAIANILNKDSFNLGYLEAATSITVTTTLTPAVYQWQQTDTQPRNSDYRLISPDGTKYIQIENTGATISGNLQVVGDLTVTGKETVVEIVDVESENDYITLRKNNPQPLGQNERAGLTIENYDGHGTHLVLNVGSDGVARVGDEGDEEPLMTRDEAGNLSEGQVIIWDAANKKAVGISIDDLFAKYVQDHTMTEAEYWAAVDAGTLKANNLYFTPIS